MDHYVSKIWPDVDIQWPRSINFYKDIQHERLCSRIYNNNNQRRFLVSNNLLSHDKHTGRGILEVMEQDEFPDKSPSRGSWLPNDNSKDPAQLRHMRDAAQYWAACMYPDRS
jgi:hypothetical protein